MTRVPVVRTRTATFEWPDDLPLVWTPAAPELSLVATSVSMLMPHVEPFVVRSIRRGASTLGPDESELAERAEAYVRQESAHHAQHRRYNRRLADDCPGLGRVDRWMGTTVGWLEAHLSPDQSVALAAGGEAVAYSAARWVEPRMGDLFRGADPTATSLFLWHLAEEVEHKDVAYDVFEATDGSRIRFAMGMALAVVLLGWFTVIGTLTLMARTGRLLNPLAHLRLIGWSLGFAFAALPVMAASVLPGSHPSELADPSWYRIWMDGHDASGAGAPEWIPPGRRTPHPHGAVGGPGRSGNGSTEPPGPFRANDR